MISLEECRKILGKESDVLSDDELQKILDQLYMLCNRVLDKQPFTSRS